MTDRARLGLGILLAALALGLLGDALLRPWPWGAGVGVWVGVLAWALVALARSQRIPLTGGGRWLILPAFVFAAAFAWHASPTLNFLNLAALLAALAPVAWRSRAGRVRVAGVMDYGRAHILAATHAAFGVLSLLTSDIQWKSIPSRGWTRRAAAIGRGAMIGLPLVLVFGALFASADAVFEDFAARLFDWDIDALITDAFIAGAWAWVSAGFLRQALIVAEPGESPKQAASFSIGLTEIVTALGLLNALFLGFVLVQVRYFFGGEEVVRTTIGLTYAEYARRGFFELVTVAALVLPILLIAHWLLPKDHSKAERVFGVLSGSLIALLFVIMASAVQRMLLYQREFGLTELRLYATAFMGWLAIVFAWFVATVLRGRRDRFAFGALIAGFAVIAGLHALNPDALIVRANTSRVDAPNPLDATYLAGLSADAVPALIEALPSLSGADRCHAAAQLLARWSPPGSVDWRAWNWSRAQAWQAVGANADRLRGWACPYAQ